MNGENRGAVRKICFQLRLVWHSRLVGQVGNRTKKGNPLKSLLLSNKPLFAITLHLAGSRKWNPFTWYNEMLEKHPIRTKCITSGGTETGLILWH